MNAISSSGGDEAAPSAYQWAEVDPSRTAVIQRDHEITFGQLIGRTNQLSHHFRELGLGVGDVVASFLENEPEYWELTLAAQQIGLYYVPINSHLKAEEAAYIVHNSGAKLLVAGAAQAGLLASNGTVVEAKHLFTLGEVLAGWRPYSDLGHGKPTGAPVDRVAGAIMGYTSGTTGQPKGVKRKVGHETPEQVAIRSVAMINSFGLTRPDGVHLVCSPLYHSAPAAFAAAALHLGHTLVVHEKFDAEWVLRDVERYGVTNSHMVPTHFHRLLSLPDKTKAAADTSSLQTAIHAGAPCPPSVKRRMIDWWGPIIWEYLGATEGIIAQASPSEWLEHPGTHGRPEPGSVVILDEFGAEQPTGESGRIFFRATLPYEYVGDPDKTRENRQGDFVTVGDLGYLDAEGYLYLKGRRDDLILSGGANVYPVEVEQALIGHPAVADVGVIGVDDEEWGQKVVAVIQLNPGYSPSNEIREDIDSFARTNLGSYKRPKQIEFLNEFPRTPSGKLIRRNLRDILTVRAALAAESSRPH
ncbi:AMP-binding protein [Pseudarthrobacter sp. B4EP4b]|uniref:AMP-binding protein n=1 Tax=Pseudarthrobacter sp. B4EP4b TaxID=2590664 RepID=UPI00114DB75B|nr:AMP-binding protein [Pseudarthrobacter sp. B4EP4b]